MISAQQVRAQVQAFNLQTDADEAARKAQLALSAPSRDRALNRRIDALVDRFIETAVTPVIDKQASDGSTSVRFFARHYRFRAHTNVDEILTNSMFGKLTYAARRAREPRLSTRNRTASRPRGGTAPESAPRAPRGARRPAADAGEVLRGHPEAAAAASPGRPV